MQEPFTAAEAHEQPCDFGKDILSAAVPTTVLCPRLMASRLPPHANLHGDGEECGTEGSMHSGSHDQEQQRMPGTAKAAKHLE